MSSIERSGSVPAWVVWWCATVALGSSGCAERLVLGVEVHPIEDGGDLLSSDPLSSATASTPTPDPASVSLDAGEDSSESTRDDDETEEEHDESEEDEGEVLLEDDEHPELPLDHEASLSHDDSAGAETREDGTVEPE